MISIANIKTSKSSLRVPRTCVKIYVGCAMVALAGNPLGNPYHNMASKSLPNRMESITMYREWLDDKLEDSSSQQSIELRRLKELYRLHKCLTLQCWCYPLPCHAEVIKEYLEAKSEPLF